MFRLLPSSSLSSSSLLPRTTTASFANSVDALRLRHRLVHSEVFASKYLPVMPKRGDFRKRGGRKVRGGRNGGRKKKKDWSYYDDFNPSFEKDRKSEGDALESLGKEEKHLPPAATFSSSEGESPSSSESHSSAEDSNSSSSSEEDDYSKLVNNAISSSSKYSKILQQRKLEEEGLSSLDEDSDNDGDEINDVNEDFNNVGQTDTHVDAAEEKVAAVPPHLRHPRTTMIHRTTHLTVTCQNMICLGEDIYP